jgi:hypothetical protein
VSVCAERVSDLIALHRLDGELQKAIDPTNTFSWRSWPDHAGQSLAFCQSTGPVEYSLKVLGELHQKREASEIAKRIQGGELTREEAIEELQAIGPEVKKEELFVDLRKIIDAGLEPERPTVAKIPTGDCLLYAGRLNEIHSEPGLGKTEYRAQHCSMCH